MESVAPSTTQSDPTVVQRWYVLIITMLVYTFSIADRYMISSVLEPIRVEFKMNDTETAFLSGISLALFYVVLGIPMSWYADRANRTRLLAVAVATWSLFTTLCGLVRTPFQLVLGRIGVGTGEAGGTPPCNSIIADYFPPDRRPMATTIFALGAPLGAWLGSDVVDLVVRDNGWRHAFFVLGAPGIVLALVIFFTIKEPPRGRYDACRKEEAPSMGETARFMLAQRGGLHVMMASALSALWGWGLMWFSSAYIERMYPVGPGGGAHVLSRFHLIGGVGATLFTAWLLAQKRYKDPVRIMRLLAVVTALATLPSYLAYYTRDLEVMKIMLWLYVPAIYFYLGPAFAGIQNAAPPKMRALFVAVSLFLANVFNLIVAPGFVGWVSDFYSNGQPTAELLRMGQLWLAPTGLWAAFHYWRAERHLAADQARISAHA